MEAIRPYTGRACLVLLLLVTSPAVHADPLEYACELAVRKLGKYAGASVTRNRETFEQDGKKYSGCVIKIEGASPCEPEMATSPWWGLYPFSDTYPSPEDGWTARGDGWKVVQEKDSRPHGLFYRVDRGTVSCLVQSTWDGGNNRKKAEKCEGDAPTGKLHIVAKCALAR